MELAPIVVDNPAEAAERQVNPVITAIRTLRDDQLGLMHDRKQISEALYRAGRQWQADHEAAGPKLKSSGDLQEPVDRSFHHRDGFTDRQIRAQARMERYAAALGARQSLLMHLVLADKLSLWAATARLFPGEATNARRTFVGHWFRDGLTILAKLMGLA